MLAFAAPLRLSVSAGATEEPGPTPAAARAAGRPPHDKRGRDWGEATLAREPPQLGGARFGIFEAERFERRRALPGAGEGIGGGRGAWILLGRLSPRHAQEVAEARLDGGAVPGQVALHRAGVPVSGAAGEPTAPATGFRGGR